jgi:hypothetical protein
MLGAMRGTKVVVVCEPKLMLAMDVTYYCNAIHDECMRGDINGHW